MKATISWEELSRVLIEGRLSSYVQTTIDHTPYIKAADLLWD